MALAAEPFGESENSAMAAAATATPNNPQNKALSDAIKGLGELMGKQTRACSTRRFKGRQGESVDPKGMQKEQGRHPEAASATS